MSRWRDTLCGSLIKSKNQDFEFPELVFSQTSELLTCGGKFHTKPQSALPNSVPSRSVCYVLPTSDYNVLVEARGDVTRYGDQAGYGDEDMDWADDQDSWGETKSTK